MKDIKTEVLIAFLAELVKNAEWFAKMKSRGKKKDELVRVIADKVGIEEDRNMVSLLKNLGAEYRKVEAELRRSGAGTEAPVLRKSEALFEAFAEYNHVYHAQGSAVSPNFIVTAKGVKTLRCSSTAASPMSSTSAPSTSAPSTSAPSTPAPSTSAPSTSAASPAPSTAHSYDPDQSSSFTTSIADAWVEATARPPTPIEELKREALRAKIRAYNAMEAYYKKKKDDKDAVESFVRQLSPLEEESSPNSN